MSKAKEKIALQKIKQSHPHLANHLKRKFNL